MVPHHICITFDVGIADSKINGNGSLAGRRGWNRNLRAETRLVLKVLNGERWGENEAPGTVGNLNRINDLLSATYSGGEGGIRTISQIEISN
jgi:hypothetical protein